MAGCVKNDVPMASSCADSPPFKGIPILFCALPVCAEPLSKLKLTIFS